jgi:sugar lactone lactonase YvrE
MFADGLVTPSAIAFDKAGNLIVADTGSHTIKSIDAGGKVTILAGVDQKKGSVDGDVSTAAFNAPVGIAVADDGRVFVADTYNDRIRVIENGRVSTLAGGGRGLADGRGADARFDTPCGIAVWRDKLLVADTGNRRIRVVEPDGTVWTLAGNGEDDVKDGLLASAAFYQPVGLAVAADGTVFVTDGNAIRQIAGSTFPFVKTISATGRGVKDGHTQWAQFNRPSTLAIDEAGSLIISDSDNRVVRKIGPISSGHQITPAEAAALVEKPEAFRGMQPARWPFDPPDAKRDIAGTLGEIRGEIPEGNDPARFHNGLDIAGPYGDTARFVRTETVLRPVAAENFGSLREFIRMPTMGYIHIRLGRSVGGVPYDDARFQFERDANGKIVGVRVPRGSQFNAGDPIGTLNKMNHVHLIAGRNGSEMNALDALIFPNLTDTRSPTIEKLSLVDENWTEIETETPASRIKLTGKARVVLRAFDQADGNAANRRLGVFKVGYQILRTDGSTIGETKWTLIFGRMPSTKAVKFAYGPGSHSGATGETIFNYVATNSVDGDEFHEGYLDAAGLEAGNYILRGFAADYFGNAAQRDIQFEVIK